MELALKELGIDIPGTYSISGGYIIDLPDDIAFGKMYSKIEKQLGDDLEYLEDISTLNTHTGNYSYSYKDTYELTLIADWDNDEYKLVVREKD